MAPEGSRNGGYQFGERERAGFRLFKLNSFVYGNCLLRVDGSGSPRYLCRYPTKCMLTGIGEYRGDRAIGYARVHVICESEDAPLDIEIALDDHEWNNQLRDGSFADWTDAAIAGCRFALQMAKKETGQWNVHRIVGLLVDTTAEYVAIASARATWNASKYDASDKNEELLRNFARALGS